MKLIESGQGKRCESGLEKPPKTRLFWKRFPEIEAEDEAD
jgi:hypothetical protein